MAWLTRDMSVRTTVAIVTSMSETSTISQGAFTVLVLAIIGMTTLSFHFFGSIWSSVRNDSVLEILVANSLARRSTASSSMFR